jgi:hypothetical protein
MPIPVGATMIASIVHFSPRPLGYNAEIHLWSLWMGPKTYSTALLVLVVCLAFLMISTLRYSSLKNVGVGNRNPRILIIGLALVVILIWFYSQWVLLIISTVYVSHGVLVKLWSLLKPRRAETHTRRLSSTQAVARNSARSITPPIIRQTHSTSHQAGVAALDHSHARSAFARPYHTLL